MFSLEYVRVEIFSHYKEAARVWQLAHRWNGNGIDVVILTSTFTNDSTFIAGEK